MSLTEAMPKAPLSPAAEPWDFGPPTGRGMRALRRLAPGDVVVQVPIEQMVTPRKCRDLLGRWTLAAADGAGNSSVRFRGLEDAVPGCGAQVLESKEEVLAACRSSGIDPENDAQRIALLGQVLMIVSVDDSDCTVELRKPYEPDGETIWFAATALARPSLSAALAAISDENIIVTALLAAKTWRDRSPACDVTALLEADERDCCPGCPVLVQEVPSEVGLCAEWSTTDLEALQGSLHAETAAGLRADVCRSWASVRGLLLGAVPNWTASSGLGKALLPFWGEREDHFLWAWVRVASRVRTSEAYPVAAKGEGKAFMVPGGIDMFNHSLTVPPGKSTRESKDGAFIEVVAQTHCNEGDEVFISYGAKGNHELLIGYGFTLEHNPNDSVELVLGLDRLESSRKAGTTLRPELCLHCLQVGEEAGNCSMLGTSKSQARFALSATDPLPSSLLGLSRLERLSDEDLATTESKLGRNELIRRLRAGESLEITSQDLQSKDLAVNCLGLICEMRAVASLRQVFGMLLARYPSKEQAAKDLSVRQRLCSELCKSEQQILQAALAASESLLFKALRKCLELARLLATDGLCKQRLIARQECIEANRGKTVQLFQELGAVPPSDESTAPAIWCQTGAFFFLLVHGGLSHPDVDASIPDVPSCWSFDATGRKGGYSNDNDSGTSVALQPRRWRDWGPVPTDPTSPDLFAVYRSKMQFWGRFLFAEFLATGGLGVQAMNDMAMESIDIRKRQAWSIPSPEALALVAAEAPLVELGAGLGLWAGLLRKAPYQAEVRAFDSRSQGSAASNLQGSSLDGEIGCFGGVQHGGPEVLSDLGSSCKALLLIWPDQQGQGTFALECVQRWALQEQGQRLICIGEWGNSSSEPRVPGLPPQGQSFSAECQKFVEEHFRLVHQLSLPNWPLTFDAVRIFERASG
eukprot:TRINITY_DN3310_c0_g1_i3.p1 TRINITY_DN3310_c0_g1~~TRINITY_DN3310_c0_g1_i3.p1  ORF type:complete len:925 (-),score=175.87 TRINITY_DN3310_c0_g1_i3:1016-3790(-)